MTIFRAGSGDAAKMTPFGRRIYALALRTGLRRNELRSLKAGSFDLDSHPPLLKVDAASSKRRKNDLLPLPSDVADAMQRYLVGRPSDQSLWPGSWWNRAAKMLRFDLAEAGIAADGDDEGRVVDFHGQRMTFITALARAGVLPATAQKLARHSDVNLTMGIYTRLQIADLADAVGKLPALRSGSDEDEKSVGTSPIREQAVTGDPLLGQIIAAWECLSDQSRRAILALLIVLWQMRLFIRS